MSKTVINLDAKKVVNKIYRKFIFDQRKEQIYYGGGGSGKSFFIAQKIIINVMTKGCFNVMVLRNTGRDNYETTFAQLVQIITQWNLNSLFQINRAKGQEMIKFLENKNTIIFKGLDKKAENRKGTTFENGALTCIWVEEASEIRENEYNQLLVRLRGRMPKRFGDIKKFIMLSFNPIDKDHWLKARFFDRPIKKEDGFTLKTTYKDNEHLDEEDKLTLEKFKDIDDYYYKVYCLGEWGDISTARVFHNVVIEEFEYNENSLDNVSYGLDFGYDHASALICCGSKENDLYIFNEFYAKGLTNTELIREIEKTGFNKHNHITADSAEPDRIEEFNSMGFRVSRSKKGHGSKRKGVDFLRNGTIYIHSLNAPNAAREFPKFKNRETTNGIIHDKYVEIDDDTIAAARYATEWRWIGAESKAIDFRP